MFHCLLWFLGLIHQGVKGKTPQRIPFVMNVINVCSQSITKTLTALVNYRIDNYNLGQIKWNIETTPPPKISDGKMARFGLHAPSSLIWGRGGISVPFYFVQDCRFQIFISNFTRGSVTRVKAKSARPLIEKRR